MASYKLVVIWVTFELYQSLYDVIKFDPHYIDVPLWDSSWGHHKCEPEEKGAVERQTRQEFGQIMCMLELFCCKESNNLTAISTYHNY